MVSPNQKTETNKISTKTGSILPLHSKDFSPHQGRVDFLSKWTQKESECNYSNIKKFELKIKIIENR